MIAKCPKPPKDNEKRLNQVRFNEKGNIACDNDENDNEHNIYASMERMSNDDKCENKDCDNSSQLTN